MPRTVEVRRCFKEGDADWPPLNAAGAVAWIQAKLNDVPEEFRAVVEIEFDSETWYDSTRVTIELAYARPESETENAKREKQESQRQERTRRQELDTLVELLAKYGPGAVNL